VPFTVVVTQHPVGQPRRLIFDKPEVTFGRVQGNDVVLPRGNVSKRHARLVLKDGKFIMVDLKSTNGTWVNGRRLTSPLVVREGRDRVFIGDFEISIEDDADDAPTAEWFPAPALDPVEERLIAAITARDHASRIVYADWLEERGDHARAEYLRLQVQLLGEPGDRPELDTVRERLRELARGLDMEWRRQVGRPAIEGCVSLEVPCPKDWGSLVPTERENVRFCEACSRSVFYCASTWEMDLHAREGACMAIDLAIPRAPGDRDAPRPMMMGAFLPPPRAR
jgi:uncharacterized protein (TIGR02996 family)